MIRKIAKILMIIAVVIVSFVCIVLLFLNFWPGIGKVPDKKAKEEYARRTEYFYDGSFHNQKDVPVMSVEQEVKSDRLKPKGQIPVIKSEHVNRGQTGKLYVTWLGHSSILVQMGEKNILIDPVFSKYSSPVGFTGVKRFSEVPIKTEDFPDIDILLGLEAEYLYTLWEPLLRLLEPYPIEYMLLGQHYLGDGVYEPFTGERTGDTQYLKDYCKQTI